MAAMSGATPSNPESVAKTLENGGFCWEGATLKDVQTKSNNISFEDEWNRFIDLVECITNSEKAATDVSETAVDSGATDISHEIDSSPWKSFEQVINPVGGHENELSFSTALFEALRTSLNDFVDPNNSNTNWIALRNCRVGFGKEISRTQLGYSDKYGLSKKSIPDHGCFVFRQIEPKADKADKVVLDMTAVIELKLENSSCKSFVFDKVSKKIEENPDFDKYHGPMGQAMLYSMDMWHCLARCGVHVVSVPVVVLAGTSKIKGTEVDSQTSQLKKAKIEKERRYPLCCLEAHVSIPEFCGEEFRYSVDRMICFDGTAGGFVPDKVSSDETRAMLTNSGDKRAIAIYVKTMRIGLEHAIKVSENRGSTPVSLCCRQLLKSGITAPLIASPIPYANSIQGSSIRIHQGEFFQLTRPTKEDFSMFRDLHWFIDVNDDDAQLPENCLVKVSCLSVHNTYINHDKCDKALKTLFDACTNNAELKQELSKVLLGYCHIDESVSLISIMRDLQAGGENFQMLEHQKLQEQGRLPQLWSAFSDLVKSLLLPMADVNVIHLDIRSSTKFTYNILVDVNSKGKGKGDDNAMELRLIDFDSVVVRGSTPKSPNQYSVFWKHLEDTLMKSGDIKKSAYRYLFWQVLWIAYMWHPVSGTSDAKSIPQEPKSEAPGALPDEPNSMYFLKLLFVDEFFVDFKEKWLGVDNLNALRSALLDEMMTRATVEKALNVLGAVFCSKVNVVEGH